MPELTPQEAQLLLQRYSGLYSSIQTRNSPEEPLLLAHYTTVPVVERILRHEQVWFANPLYMNDLGEMRSGLLLASQIFPEYAQRVGGSVERVQSLLASYNHYVAYLSTEAALDTYVFCLSEHPIGDTDGRLSMWREYADKGNGAALVFNAQKLHYQEHSPLIIAKVAYKTDAERALAIRELFEQWAQATTAPLLPDNALSVAAFAAFDLAKTLALTTKHKGFDEEDEWRVIYVPERDPRKYLHECLDYFVGPRGVEPKLKLGFGRAYLADPAPSAPQYAIQSLTDILEFILLGPSASSPLSRAAFVRMLERINKAEFTGLVFPSTIPLRPA